MGPCASYSAARLFRSKEGEREREERERRERLRKKEGERESERDCRKTGET